MDAIVSENSLTSDEILRPSISFECFRIHLACKSGLEVPELDVNGSRCFKVLRQASPKKTTRSDQWTPQTSKMLNYLLAMIRIRRLISSKERLDSTSASC